MYLVKYRRRHLLRVQQKTFATRAEMDDWFWRSGDKLEIIRIRKMENQTTLDAVTGGKAQ